MEQEIMENVTPEVFFVWDGGVWYLADTQGTRVSPRFADYSLMLYEWKLRLLNEALAA
jgi:hypothetical protein